jgi:hypothetical protein
MTSLGHMLTSSVLLVSATGCALAADREFSGLLQKVSHRYEAHVTHIPLMGFASFCARVMTHGGVKHLRVAEFDDVPERLDVSELQSLFRETLSADWQPFVVERDQKGKNLSVIFVRPAGKAMRMLIADYDHKELDLVQLELNGDRLAQWVKKPGRETWNQESK